MPSAFTRVLIIACVSIAAALPLFLYGITQGPDLKQHFQFADTVRTTLSSGGVYPSFSIDQNGGLGDVGLRFYPPLTYYILTPLYFAVGDWFNAVVSMYVLVMFVGGLGIYLWAREFLTERHSVLAAGIFIVAPYHLSQIFQSFLLAEFTASAIVPFCFLFVTRIARRGSAADVAGLAAAYSLLTLTHLPSTMLVSICLAIFSFAMIDTKRIVSYGLKLVVAATVALGASSFYWIRMVSEMAWVKHSYPEYFTGAFDFSNNFLFGFGYIYGIENDGRSLWFADMMLGATIVIAVPAILYLVRRQIDNLRFVASLAVVMSIGVIMATPLSTPVWQTFIFLQKIQFPWRWICVITPLAAILGSIGIIKIADAGERNALTPAKLGLTAILALFVFTTAFLVKGAIYMPRAAFDEMTANISASPSYIAWWPLWAKESAFEVKDLAFAAGRQIEVVAVDGTNKRFKVAGGEPSTMRVRTFYYPHWRADVNGAPVDVSPDNDGLITLPLAADAAEVRLLFAEPARARRAVWVSIFAWLAIAALALVGFRKHK